MTQEDVWQINNDLVRLMRQHHVPSQSELAVWKDNLLKVSEYIKMRIDTVMNGGVYPEPHRMVCSCGNKQITNCTGVNICGRCSLPFASYYNHLTNSKSTP